LKIKKIGQNGRLKPANEWIYGINPVFEAIKAGRNIANIYFSSTRYEKTDRIREEAELRNIPVKTMSPGFFDSTFRKGHQGVAAEVSPREYSSLDELLNIPVKKNEIPLFLILDCLEDPRNLGAILRVADAAGVHGIILQSHRSVNLSAEVSKVSAGAVEYVPVAMVVNIKHAIYEMKESGITVVGTEAGAENVYWNMDFTHPLALVIGSEGKGLRKTVSDLCDVRVSIPMQGKVNSLNVSVATGIFAFEILRQRIRKY
jgi:23S rRNA (guanosine2251-2'-O)-methyltransferase